MTQTVPPSGGRADPQLFMLATKTKQKQKRLTKTILPPLVWHHNSGAVEDFILRYSAVYLRMQK